MSNFKQLIPDMLMLELTSPMKEQLKQVISDPKYSDNVSNIYCKDKPNMKFLTEFEPLFE